MVAFHLITFHYITVKSGILYTQIDMSVYESIQYHTAFMFNLLGGNKGRDAIQFGRHLKAPWTIHYGPQFVSCLHLFLHLRVGLVE